jgi:hypothetical protein
MSARDYLLTLLSPEIGRAQAEQLLTDFLVTSVPTRAAAAAEIERLRQQVRTTRNDTLRERAADIVSYCPDHGTRDTMRDTCRCEVASEILLACEAVTE